MTRRYKKRRPKKTELKTDNDWDKAILHIVNNNKDMSSLDILFEINSIYGDKHTIWEVTDCINRLQKRGQLEKFDK